MATWNLVDRFGIEPNKDGLQGLPALQRAAHISFYPPHGRNQANHS